MSGELTWLTSLPRLPGHDDAYVLLEGPGEHGGTVSIVGVPYGDGGYSVHYFSSRGQTLVEVTRDASVPHFKPTTRMVYIGLEQLAGYVMGAAAWAYSLDAEVKNAASVFTIAQLIDGDAWNDTAAAWYAGRDPVYRDDMPEGSGLRNIRERVRVPLLDYMHNVRAGDDPRELVVSVTQEQIGDQDCRRLKIRKDMFRLAGAEAIDRRLRAALPGVDTVEVSDDASGDFYNALVENCETVLVRGTLDQAVWDDLSEYAINSRLTRLPNDPVVRVVEGQHLMQVLLVLAYPPDEDELVYIQNGVFAVTHAALAQPEWVYGTNVVSLLVPGLYRDVDVNDIEKALREDLTFIN